MIETAQNVVIDAPIGIVWDYVKDMRQWAALLPGCKECIVEDEQNSRWVMKVGTGGLVRTVKALVHVDQWAGPGRVDFSYTLEGDPVEGSGSYAAEALSPGQTAVTLRVRVQGGGPLAAMWEAMSRPLLPLLAKSFATKLKGEIEKAGPADGGVASEASEAGAPTLVRKLRNILSPRGKD